MDTAPVTFIENHYHLIPSYTQIKNFVNSLNKIYRIKTFYEVDNFLGRDRRLQWNVWFHTVRLSWLMVAESSNWVQCLAANQSEKENKRLREDEEDFAVKLHKFFAVKYIAKVHK